MEIPQILIQTEGAFSEVYIDGKKIEGVNGYEFRHNAGKFPQLCLSMNGLNVSLENRKVPALPEPFRSFYVSKSALVNAGIATFEQLDALDGDDAVASISSGVRQAVQSAIRGIGAKAESQQQ